MLFIDEKRWRVQADLSTTLRFKAVQEESITRWEAFEKESALFYSIHFEKILMLSVFWSQRDAGIPECKNIKD